MKQTLYQPARLSDLISRYPKTMQRHIHTVVIREVSSGALRGVKLKDKFELPHCNTKEPIPKTDVGFAGHDVPGANKLIAQVVERYSAATPRPSDQPSFDEFLELGPQEYEELLRAQAEAQTKTRRRRKR